MGTICESELDKNIEVHKWKIKFIKTKNKNISVGIAPIDFDINSSTETTCGWYCYCNNSFLYSGPPFNYSGKNINLKYMKNNEIKIIFNMKKRTLKFIINEEDNGDSYINIPIDKPLFPAICMYNQDDCVEISEY